MKIVNDDKLVALADEFVHMREIIKDFEAQQRFVRSQLLAAMGDEHSALIGNWILVLSERVRTDLDKDALAEELGERLHEFQRLSNYNVLDVKRA